MTAEEAQAALGVLGIADWSGSAQALMDSAKWQEKVDALTALGTAVQTNSMGGALAVPLVAYLKAKTAGFKISNVSVAKAVMQVVVSAAQGVGSAKFSKSAAWEIIRAFGDRFSDKKTQDISVALMTALSEVTSPAFVVKRMKVVMDKTKAPLAHQYFLEWVKTSVQEFGATSFPVQFLASFCQAELDNKVAAVRTAAVEVMGALYHQIGPRLQSIAIAEDCKPQLKSLLEAEFAKVGFDPTAAKQATRAVKGEEGSASASAGSAIPRQDLTAALDKNIISELNLVEGKTSWQNRKAAMEAIIAGCERSGHYLEASKGTLELVRALKPRLNDTQANLKPIASAAIGHIVTSMDTDNGVKVLRFVASSLIGAVADNKKAMRDSAIATLQSIVTLNGSLQVADPQLMGCLLTSSAEGLSNPVGRQELLAWIQLHVDGAGVRVECNDIADALVLSLQDKMAVVRTLAEQVLTALIAKALINRQAVDKATRDLPPATKRALQGSIDRMLAAFGTKRAAAVGQTAPVAEAAHVEVKEEAAPAAAPVAAKAAAASSSAAGAAPRPAQTASHAPAAAPAAVAVTASSSSEDHSSGSESLKRTNKSRRNEEFFKQNWPQPPEDPGENEFAALKREWEPLISADMAQLLFPQSRFGAPTQESMVNGAMELVSLISSHTSVALTHSDFILRWATYVLCLREAATGLLKILQLFQAVFEASKSLGLVLHDAEAGLALPHLIERCGHKSDRHKAAFKAALVAASDVLPAPKMCAYLLQGLTCKNKKTRVVCLEELDRIVSASGYTCLGKAGVKEVAAAIDSKDNDVAVKSAALDVAVAMYAHCGCDLGKLLRLCGDIADKIRGPIESRIKERQRSGPPLPTGSAAAAARSGDALPVAPSSSVAVAVAAVVVPPPVVPPAALSPDVARKAPPSISAAAATAAAAYSPKGVIPSQTSAALGGPVIPRKSIMGGRGQASSSSSEEAGTAAAGLPYSLDLTPPAPVQASIQAPAEVRVALWSQPDRRGAATTSPVPATRAAAAAEDNVVTEIGAVYEEIAGKVGLMVQHYPGYLQGGQAMRVSVDELQSICDDCREYLKMLHTLVSGAWATDGRLMAAGDESTLFHHAQPLISMVMKCVLLALEGAGPSARTEASFPVAAKLKVDVSMISVGLATLHAYVTRRGVVSRLSNDALVELVSGCVLAISNEKVAQSDGAVAASADAASEACENIRRVLLLILSKTAEEAGTVRIIAATLQALFQCIVEVDHSVLGDSAATRCVLPERCAKPLSKLLLKVLTDEHRQPKPFQFNGTDINQVLRALHQFFSRHPTEMPANNTPFCAAKTVLVQIVKALGAPQLIITLQQTLDIPASAFICR